MLPPECSSEVLAGVLIGEQWLADGPPLEVINPSTEALIATVGGAMLKPSSLPCKAPLLHSRSGQPALARCVPRCCAALPGAYSRTAKP